MIAKWSKPRRMLLRCFDIPTAIRALKQYVYRLKSADPAGGMIWTNIKLRHDVSIQDILEYAKDEFREVEFGIYIQSVQHYNVKVLG